MIALSSRFLSCALLVVAISTVAEAASIGDEGATAISPGASERALEVASVCPSFSWSAVEGASAYRLRIFEVVDGGAAELRVAERIGGVALSWTPSIERCMAPGRKYAWMVRAELGSAGELGAWSAPLYFHVPGAPSIEELEAALRVLERWRAEGGGVSGNASRDASEPAGDRESDEVAGGTPPREVSAATGVAAIRGEITDVGGTAYGVFGISHSSQGAGVVARNESAGADLILDGEAQGLSDTIVTQSGIDRPSGAAQSFEFGNSGAGAMTLTVDGVSVDTAATPIDWERLSGVPAGFADGVDDGTTYGAGNQLSLVATQFHVLEGADSGLDADLLDGLDGASYQARVMSTCPPGQSMQGINADGSVVCYEVPVPPRITEVDIVDLGEKGFFASLAIGVDGFPVISYQLAFPGDSELRVSKCNDAACTGGDETTTIVVNSAYDPGFYTSLAIGTDGFPVISYQERSVLAYGLRVAKCNDAACAGGDDTNSPVDHVEAQYVGAYNSLAIGADGFPVVSYQDLVAGSLKVAKCNDAACAGGDETITTVDDPGDSVGLHTSLAIGTDGFPVISYQNGTAGALKVAKCNDAACAGADETITTVDDPINSVGLYTSLAIGTDGFPVISYQDGTAGVLKVARCNDAACAGEDETITTIDDPINSVGRYTSLAIGTDGFPVISYQDSSAGTLRVAKCNDPACAGGDETITTVDDPSGSVGYYTSLAIGTDGFPVISNQDQTAFRLRVAKCRNSSCSF